MAVGLLVGAFLAVGVAHAQGAGGFNFDARMHDALSEPFVGLTVDGSTVPGLFSLEETGISTEDVRLAAVRFASTLSNEQRERLYFPIDDSEWRNWANVHLFERQGVGFDEMTEAQRDAAYAFLQTALSPRGYRTSRDIMRLNHHVAELVSNFEEYGEHLYWLTFMGTPSATEPWGWQLDGHHLVINYFVLGDQLVMTPTFMGSEPISADSGRYAGTRIMDAEQELAVQFMRSLSGEEQGAAIVSRNKGRGNGRAAMMSDNVVIPYQGISAARLDESQRDSLLDLIELYVSHMPAAHATLRMDEIRAHLDETYFAWIGEVSDKGVFYYRVQSPVVYIEFDHQGPVALSGPRGVPTRTHVHTTIRTPNGNDYGKDLLRLHYARFANDPGHGHLAAVPPR
jgi:hypothetical protein